ncbi:hypothetical protein [Kitasatospora sp. MBT63]|uniref:hypothetical protein n=1 Tax=Kitasatospora sp. MBT63 TaxID=1444768 RepID=UPI00053B904D|nr:hypothetical protein [Kitasatospora sp. MBT63]
MLPAYNGKLYWLIDDSGLRWSSYGAGMRSAFTEIGGSSPYGPGMAALGNRLCVAWRGSSNEELYWRSFDGSAWTALQRFPSGATSNAMVLAAHDGKLHCEVREDGTKETLRWCSFDGTTWSRFTALAAASPTHPGVASYNGNLYEAHIQ